MKVSYYRKFIRRVRSTPLKALQKSWAMFRGGGIGGVIEVVRTYATINQQYQQWRTRPQFTSSQPLFYQPLISVIMPTYNVEERWLRQAIESVLAQKHERWELCIADDASPQPQVRQVIEEYAARDTRIQTHYRTGNGHIAAASNTALAMASGEYIALLDHDDEISPDALLEVVSLLNRYPEADFIYSDEDKIEPDGITHTEPFFKPGWSPQLLLCCNYITHFAVIRRTLVEQVGGFRDAFVGSQDYDLFLRITDHTDKIFHIPKVLYSWRKIATSTADGIEAKSYAMDASFRALTETIERRKLNAKVETGLYYPFLRVRPVVPRAEVSVITLRSESTSYSQALMQGVEDSKGDFLLFLPDGVQLNDISVNALLEIASQDNVGCVGGKIVDRRRRLLHAGLALGVQGAAGRPGCGITDITHAIFYFDLKDAIREISAVSWVGMMIARDLFLSVGGFNIHYKNSLFDVDLCLRLSQMGYANVYTPFSRLVLNDPSVLDVIPADEKHFHSEWGTPSDPFYNPNLTHSQTNLSIAQ